MSRFGRIRRRPDHWSSPHERARARAAERLDGPLGLSEATWLDEHLGDCTSCSAIAASYEVDRQALRALREALPEPPRDLWARTAAAIERESAAHGRSTVVPAPRRASRIPMGALSGVAVIAVVVGVSAVSGGLFNGTGNGVPMAGVGSSSPGPGGVDTASSPAIGVVPTPFSVGAGEVQWVGTAADGSMAYNAASIRKVCPVDNTADCAALDGFGEERLALTTTPKSIIGSPTQGQAVVVSDDGQGGQQVLILSLPESRETAAPTSSPTPTPPEPTTPATAEPTTTTAPPTDAPSTEPTTTTEPPATEPPATDAPSATPATAEPTAPATTEPSPSASVGPTLSPEPTMATSLAIARGIAVVGESAAFSADGAWFAFTARPVDGSAGPDVFVWHVGDESARALTTGGASYFASWDGQEVVASRAGTPGTDGSSTPVTVTIDPATGAERPGGDLWRPVLDPTAGRAVAWVGTVTGATADTTVSPSSGQLELVSWPAAEGQDPPTDAPQVVATEPIADFDVRWDESGTWFATWISDPSGTDVGRLSLYRVDPETGLLERPAGAPDNVPALSGFSIGQGRLAWATPPGQGGEGSRVQIVAWAPGGVGTVETAPGEDLIVVR
jgi:hypothetical protein